MTFVEITANTNAAPGEYLYHIPTRQIVMCGAFSRSKGEIRALANGKLLTDVIANFQKIEVSRSSPPVRTFSKCKGCGS